MAGKADVFASAGEWQQVPSFFTSVRHPGMDMFTSAKPNHPSWFTA